MSARDDILAFAHIGDLHLTVADGDNARDFLAIADQIGEAEGLDFVFLPGDNADNGTPAQYALVRQGLDRLRLPVHVITGDHDMEGGGLDAFHDGLGVPRLPYAVDVSGIRCLFLDICGPGSGGPDFRLGAEQRAWLEAELRAGEREGLDCALFMHSYPADLKGAGEAEAVGRLVFSSRVRLVEMGHTHYNELANDGRTIYAATRSTGQVEEGPVGYAIVAVDRGVVAWRFKELSRPWPFVMVTAPADRRLAHDDAHVVEGSVEIRAVVFGPARIAACEFSIDGSPWRAMGRAEGDRRFGARVDWPAGARRLTVRVTDAEGGTDEDVVEPAAELGARPTSKGIGSDADAVGAWPEKGLVGTQLGPNRNGRHW
ncbi:metallophosphoesterase family protein [Methylobacterium trifolii]|uniref:3',5'-cyclic adenosine monophosphate phosphodiesterase CpdA n=1 Tax=Methylobacterium trifolii TaxID=1003092 RepID=A0ABQ4U3D7_9HYPH|nr:metallophosphoesterase [Methylobacterium trifolii]GJE61369.1 3',5'-cyclic adenosine monophosphate phosphodiesterase CpdA [Methylobacterium trifolii]